MVRRSEYMKKSEREKSERGKIERDVDDEMF